MKTKFESPYFMEPYTGGVYSQDEIDDYIKENGEENFNISLFVEVEWIGKDKPDGMACNSQFWQEVN